VAAGGKDVRIGGGAGRFEHLGEARPRQALWSAAARREVTPLKHRAAKQAS